MRLRVIREKSINHLDDVEADEDEVSISVRLFLCVHVPLKVTFVCDRRDDEAVHVHLTIDLLMSVGDRFADVPQLQPMAVRLRMQIADGQASPFCPSATLSGDTLAQVKSPFSSVFLIHTQSQLV